jgi:putative transposase
MIKHSPFRYFKTSHEVIRLAVMLYVRFPLPLRNLEDLLHERGIEVSHETVRFWWNRFGSMFASVIARKRRKQAQSHSNWQWHFDEVFVKINGERHYLWRAVDHKDEVLESYVSKRIDRKTVLKLIRKSMKRNGQPGIIVTDKLRSYCVAMMVIGNAYRQAAGRWVYNQAEILTYHLGDERGRCWAFDERKPGKNSFQSMLQSRTISTGNAIFIHAPILS